MIGNLTYRFGKAPMAPLAKNISYSPYPPYTPLKNKYPQYKRSDIERLLGNTAWNTPGRSWGTSRSPWDWASDVMFMQDLETRIRRGLGRI